MRTVTYKGREFTSQGTEPYTRNDGVVSAIETWVGVCQHPGCGASYTFATAASATPETSKAFGRTNCEQHRLTRDEVMAKARAAKAAKRKT